MLIRLCWDRGRGDLLVLPVEFVFYFRLLCMAHLGFAGVAWAIWRLVCLCACVRWPRLGDPLELACTNSKVLSTLPVIEELVGALGRQGP